MTLAPVYNHVWQSTVFAAAAGLLSVTLRRNRARVRHGLWLAASIKFLIPLSLLIGLGNQIQWHRVPSSDLSAAVIAMSEPFTMPLASAPPPAKPSRQAADPLPAILTTVWALGFLGIASSWWLRWRRIAAVVRAASPVPLELPIQAVATTTVVEPGVFGVVRPVLLLPASIFERLSPDQLNAVIAHELYHVRNHDNLVAAFHMFVETAFWFHPIVWWIGRRMLEERERACDEGVLSMGSEPRVYAEAVLNVCKLYVESSLDCVSGITGADLKRRIEVIMTKRIAHDLNFAYKLGLAIAALAALLGPVFIGMIHSPAAHAQSPAATPAPAPAPVAAGPEFEVASIKPNRTNERMYYGLRNDRLTVRNMPVKGLIQIAYGKRDFQITGGPAWITSECFDVDAKAERPQRATHDMMKSLLASRFHLELHSETKKTSVYSLVVARGGLKMKLSADQTEPQKGGPKEMGPGRLVGEGIPMYVIVNLLANMLGRAVINNTSLTGKYDVNLQPLPDSQQLPTDLAEPPTQAEVFNLSIVEAVQKQLGLKLESLKAPEEVLVIDHIEHPSAN